jgi:hypothetical protein
MIVRGLTITVVALVLVLPASARSTLRPVLRLQASSPAQIAGSHFALRERVRLELTSGGPTWKKTVRTNARGAFVATFLAASVDRCNGFTIVARGARGDLATLKGMPFGCPPSP